MSLLACVCYYVLVLMLLLLFTEYRSLKIKGLVVFLVFYINSLHFVSFILNPSCYLCVSINFFIH